MLIILKNYGKLLSPYELNQANETNQKLVCKKMVLFSLKLWKMQIHWNLPIVDIPYSGYALNSEQNV